MKRFICIFIIVVISLSLFACSNNLKPSDSFEERDTEKQTDNESLNGNENNDDYVGFWRQNSEFGCSWYWGDEVIETPEITTIAEEKDIVYPTVRQFMESDLESGAVILENYYRDLKSFQTDNLDGQNLEISWDSDGAEYFTVCIADNEYYKNAYTKTVTETSLSSGICVPGKTYYYKVYGKNGTNIVKEGVFKAKDVAPRIIDIEGTHNVRDIGGYKTEDGKTVNYGLMYRGAELNGYKIGSKLSLNGAAIMKNTLGIKTEIDLRNTNDDGGQTSCEFGGNYLKASIAQYYWLIPENQTERIGGNTWYDGNTALYLRNIFAMLADKNNYPFYFHCNWGRDRTGTLAFLLNGLLGVSYEDLIKDWELTTFWYCYGYSAIDDGTGGIGTMYRMLMQYYNTGDGKLSSAIENYLVNAMQVPKAHIDSFKAIMTGGVEIENPIENATLITYSDRNGIKFTEQFALSSYDFLSKIYDITVGALFIPSDLLTNNLTLENRADKVLNIVADYPYKNAYKSNYEFRMILSDIPKDFSGEISAVGYIILTDRGGNQKIFYTSEIQLTI